MATKKVAKKVAAPKPAKVAPAANKKFIKTIPFTKPTVQLVSFSVTAIIPTERYGNIQPKIEVTASSIEEARAFVMPVIENLYKTYGEGKPTFLGRVTETIRVVKAITDEPLSKGDLVKTAPQTAPTAPQAQDVPSPVTTAYNAPEAPQKPKSEAVMKAEKKISMAMSADAALAIQDQIEKSVKIAPEEKPDLITLVLKKRGEFK